ncbi:MAG TPA: zinc ribbon domain-containing protein [Acidimicrobiia bacterium]|nr:zinc ribbon domain-containing protein [Acidimicrobiia bacterium]
MTGPRPRGRSRGGNVISVTSDGATDSPYEEFSLDQPPSTPQDTPPQPVSKGNGNGNGGPVNCPSCGALNPGNNRHCQECGARLKQGPLPTAPRPAVQATAGVRAALAISALLLGVILIALFFNIFNGTDPEASGSSTTAPSTTFPPIQEEGPIDILEQTCTPQGIGTLVCANLTSGTPDEYQVSWEEVSEQGIVIELDFVQPMAITGIQWTNIADETRFFQNYRAQSLVVVAQDSLAETPVLLQDQQGTQQVPYSALNTTTLTITIVEAYEAVVTDGDVFDELAIDEIVIIGRPVQASTESTVPASTTTPTTSGG